MPWLTRRRVEDVIPVAMSKVNVGGGYWGSWGGAVERERIGREGDA